MPTPTPSTSGWPTSPFASVRRRRPRATCGSMRSSRRPGRPGPRRSIRATGSCPSERRSPAPSRTRASSSSDRRRPSSRHSGDKIQARRLARSVGVEGGPGDDRSRSRSTDPTPCRRSSPRRSGSASRCWSRRRPAVADAGCAGWRRRPNCPPRWPPGRPRRRRPSVTDRSSSSARSGRRATSRSSCWAMRPAGSWPSASAIARSRGATRSWSRRRPRPV